MIQASYAFPDFETFDALARKAGLRRDLDEEDDEGNVIGSTPRNVRGVREVRFGRWSGSADLETLVEYPEYLVNLIGEIELFPVSFDPYLVVCVTPCREFAGHSGPVPDEATVDALALLTSDADQLPTDQGFNPIAVRAHNSGAVNLAPDKRPTLRVQARDGKAKNAQERDVPQWVQPTGAQDAYVIDSYVRHKNNRWRSLTGANVWEPGVSSWRLISGNPNIPAQWIQPTGAQDAYEKNDVVSRDAPDRLENVWRSKIQANATAPGEDGIAPHGPWFDRYWEPIEQVEWRQLQRGGAV